MSNPRDGATNFVTNRPSTSHSASPLRSKSSHNNARNKVNTTPKLSNTPSKIPPAAVSQPPACQVPPSRSKSLHNNTSNKVNTTSKSSSTPKKIPSAVFYNSGAVNDLAGHCNNLDIESDEESVQSDAISPSTEKTTAKENKLHLQMPPSQVQSAIQSAPAAPTQGGQSVIHELFLKQIAPLYASSSTRYLETLANNHQLQVVQNAYFRELFHHQYHPMSAPSTPLLHQAHSSNSQMYPHPALLQHPNGPPKFLQNMLQHPLLGKNFVNMKHNNFSQNHASHAAKPSPAKKNNSPKRRKRQKQNEVKNFDPYISAEEVEIGLKNNTLIEGVLRINPKQFQHSYVASMDRSEQDILIDGIKNRNRALEGDIVVVQFVASDNEANGDTKEKKENIVNKPNKEDDNNEQKEEDDEIQLKQENEDKQNENDDNKQNENDDKQQKKGKVVFIKEKVHNRTCIGILKLMEDKNRQKALFVPRDNRMPRLNIPFTSWPNNFYEDAKKYENTLFLAKIIEWFDTRFALGTIVCNIGECGDMESETKAILAQTDLDITPFGPEVRHLFPRLDYTIPDEELKLREDCRKLCIFSIDPFNCRDIDDAVSCRKLENGNYEIGVHISDVAHFLTENTLLDEKVAEKATTIYMVERAYHMLPDELCMLCSLFPGVDKLAFSVFWEITDDAQVLSHRFAKTVINSCCQLAYDHAQAILEDKQDAETSFPELYNGFTYQDVYNTIKTLGKISATFRKRRFEGGALRIDQPKVSFHLNPTNGLPDSYWIYDSKESHQLIEEFMLLANMTVAKRIHEDHPKLAFLRCHPPPSTYMLNQLAKSLKPMGIDIEISSAGELHRSLLPYVSPDCEDRGRAMVLNMLCAKPMTRARYFCAGGCDDDDDFHHYALNVPLYTHFTSPIRRYADIMVHR